MKIEYKCVVCGKVTRVRYVSSTAGRRTASVVCSKCKKERMSHETESRE